MRTAIYLRVSTEDQANGFGLDVQEEKARAMATVKGWPVVHVFQDDGISGTLDERSRTGLAALLRAARRRRVDAVIVASLDRLGRKTSLVLTLVEKLKAAGVALISCKESLDTSTASGQFVLTMFAALAQLERDTIVERTTDGRNQRGRVDGEKGGRVPLGYARHFDDRGKARGVQVDDLAAVVVRRIFTERDAGATLSAIADGLNADGIRTARGRAWHASSVRTVLQNEPVYRGGARGESRLRWPAIL